MYTTTRKPLEYVPVLLVLTLCSRLGLNSCLACRTCRDERKESTNSNPRDPSLLLQSAIGPDSELCRVPVV
ncbi:hypothetical protein F5X96DRAFT_657789 [Biscogniauxia mediterranea]|nr:hypothetical protein F5X96DRAFT_657789 [Biscogniauxia mediterranea]